jgi:hypothetical protein
MMHRSWKPSTVLMQQGSKNESRSLGGSTDHGGNVRVEPPYQWERRHPHIPIGVISISFTPFKLYALKGNEHLTSRTWITFWNNWYMIIRK